MPFKTKIVLAMTKILRLFWSFIGLPPDLEKHWTHFLQQKPRENWFVQNVTKTMEEEVVASVHGDKMGQHFWSKTKRKRISFDPSKWKFDV